LLKLPLLLSFPLVRPQPNHLLESRYDVCGSTQCDRVFRVGEVSLLARSSDLHISSHQREDSPPFSRDERRRSFTSILPTSTTCTSIRRWTSLACSRRSEDAYPESQRHWIFLVDRSILNSEPYSTSPEKPVTTLTGHRYGKPRLASEESVF